VPIRWKLGEVKFHWGRSGRNSEGSEVKLCCVHRRPHGLKYLALAALLPSLAACCLTPPHFARTGPRSLAPARRELSFLLTPRPARSTACQHFIEARQYSFEVQLVHFNSIKYNSLTDAMMDTSDDDALLVVAQVCHISPTSDHNLDWDTHLESGTP